MTPAFAEREVLVDFFFPPLLDILSVLGLEQHSIYKEGGKKKLSIRTDAVIPYIEFQDRSVFCVRQRIRVPKTYTKVAFSEYIQKEPKKMYTECLFVIVILA